MPTFDDIPNLLERLALAAEHLVELLTPTNPPGPAPSGLGEIHHLGERHFFGDLRMDIEQFSWKLPEHPTPDVTSRTVVVAIGEDITVPDGFPRVQSRTVAGREAAETDQSLDPDRDIANEGAFEVPQDATYSVTVVAVDDKQNPSPPTSATLTAEDRTAPAASGLGESNALGERTV